MILPISSPIFNRIKPSPSRVLRSGLPDQVEIVTKNQVNGQEQPDVIARTGSDIVYIRGQKTFALLDFDTKAMPREVADKIAASGGFWQALITVLPDLSRAEHLIRRSTSAGLTRSDTGEQLKGSGGLHAYIAVRDGTDAVRFLSSLHERCWLNGLGWMMIARPGSCWSAASSTAW